MKYKQGDDVTYYDGKMYQRCGVIKGRMLNNETYYFIQCGEDIVSLHEDELSYYKPEDIDRELISKALKVRYDKPKTNKQLIVICVEKDMTTEECIEHAKKIEAHLGGQYRVLVLDSKVSEYEVVEDK